MNKLLKRLILSVAIASPLFASAGNLWHSENIEKAPVNLQLIHPAHYLLYTLDEATLKLQLTNLGSNPDDGIIITLPLADGTYRNFKVWQTSMMPEQLSAEFPDLHTFTAEAVDNHLVTAKLDFTLYGFHAMIYDGANTSFVDPFDNFRDGYYMVHYKKDEVKPVAERMKCQVSHPGNTVTDEHGPAGESMDIEQKGLPKMAFKTINGYQLRTYRLALACNTYYSIAATGLPTPTKAQVLSKMTTSMNRINGVLERELSITFTFIANESAIIFVNAAGDPFYADNNIAGNLIMDNQTTCDALIGNANYDYGHVFTTGAGGYSSVGIVCQNGLKAQTCTGQPTPTGDGFDIDYVVHEMGHACGTDHTFNNGADGSCGSANRAPELAYEPGSGSTIMAYAGLCSPDDLQFHSDAYYHAASLKEITNYMTTDGDVCAVKTNTGNKLVKYSAFNASYSIPYKTPFELYAPALTDSVADSATLYCWEEWDLEPLSSSGSRLINTTTNGPLFRSYNPTPSNLRVFPKESMMLAGILSNAGIEGAEGEKIPDVARTLNFVCTFRNIAHNKGCFTIPDDKVTLNVINTGIGFAVTSQGTTGISLNGHSSQTITWDIAGTNVSPINAPNVRIYMSVDGGYTWLYFIGTFPNTGSATITLPNPGVNSSTCRFKVKGENNVFFNVNKNNFEVTYNSSFPISVGLNNVAAASGNVKLYPVPATNLLHVAASGKYDAAIYNTVGQQVWNGEIGGQMDIPVGNWARGIYYMQTKDENGQSTVKRFILE